MWEKSLSVRWFWTHYNDQVKWAAYSYLKKRTAKIEETMERLNSRLQHTLQSLVLVEQAAKRTIAILNMINQIIIGTINQQWKHLMKHTAVPKVSCVVGSRPMREQRLSTNQNAGICRARTSHLLLPILVPGSAKQAESFLTPQLLWTYALNISSDPSLISS